MNPQLLAERIEQELDQIRELVARTDRLMHKVRQTGDEDYLDAAALYLHSFYTEAERIFVAIAREVDQEIPTGSEWHQQLLEQMSVEFSHLRLPVLCEQTRLELDEFRRFRHVVRSNYAYKLDPKRIIALAQKLSVVSQHLVEDSLLFCVELQQQSYPPAQDTNQPPSDSKQKR